MIGYDSVFIYIYIHVSSFFAYLGAFPLLANLTLGCFNEVGFSVSLLLPGMEDGLLRTFHAGLADPILVRRRQVGALREALRTPGNISVAERIAAILAAMHGSFHLEFWTFDLGGWASLLL